jgi:oligoendopeptidase F
MTSYALPPRPARQHLREDFDASNPLHVQEVLLRLVDETPDDFRAANDWYALFQEASSAISELHTRLELALQLNTGDADSERKLRLFDENILSQMLKVRGQLMDVYLASPWKYAMHPDDNGRITVDFRSRRRYASPEIIELQLAENQLVRDYRGFMNAATARCQGRPTPVSVIIGRLNDNDAAARKEAFLAYWGFVESHEDTLQDMFQRLLENRNAQAAALRIPSFVPFAFAELGRVDYGPDECSRFRGSIAQAVVPVATRLALRQGAALGTTGIKPWDVHAWPGLAPTTPPAGGNLADILRSMGRISTKIHPSFGRLFNTMLEQGLIDVAPRARKSPGAFCVTFQESRMPFIFGNFAGTFKDALTLVHEFGHAVHGYATGTIPNVLLRHPGLEFCEVASMGLEMLAAPHFSEWWPHPTEARRALGYQLFAAVQFWPFMAMIDGFQHAVCAEASSTADSRNRIWLDHSRTYRPHVDWTGYERYEKLGWFSRPHVFTSPFYYIDYGIAQLGAVQLWRAAQRDYPSAVESYVTGLSLGAQRSLPELFASAGLRLDFSAELLSELVGGLEEEILGCL